MSTYQKRYGQLTARWQDFSAGEYGGLRGRRAQGGQWSGTNVVVFTDGSIGPRQGLRNAQPPIAAGNFPDVVILANVSRITSHLMWVLDITGTVFYATYPGGTGAWTQAGGAGGGQTGAPIAVHDYYVDSIDDTDQSYFTVFNNGVFRFDHTTHNLGEYVGSPGGSAITISGEFLVVARLPGADNQIRWSAPNDYTTWPVTNVLNVGRPGDVIRDLTTVRNVLVVTMDDGDIWLITGVLGVNSVTRQFTSFAPRNASLLSKRIVTNKRGVMWRRGRIAMPESFDGTQLRALTYLNNWIPEATAISADVAATQGPDEDDILFADLDGHALLYRLHAWSKHEFALPSVAPFDYTAVYACADGDQAVMFVYAVDSADPFRDRYADLQLARDRPPCASLGDITEDFGSSLAPVASWTSPEQRDTYGRPVHPHKVVVQFTKYLTGAVQTNHFEVRLNIFDVYETEGPPSPIAIVWDQANDAAGNTTDGVRCERMFSMDAGLDVGGFSVTIANIRGVKIDAVEVFSTTPVVSPERGG